jgi:hypothetical protein
LAEGITNVALVADTDGDMVPDTAVGVLPTETRTEVLALPSDAGLVKGAVRVDHTLRSTVGWGTNHFRQAGALALSTNVSCRMRIWTAGVGVTGVRDDRLDGWENMRFSKGTVKRSFINLVTVCNKIKMLSTLLSSLLVLCMSFLCVRTRL